MVYTSLLLFLPTYFLKPFPTLPPVQVSLITGLYSAGSLLALQTVGKLFNTLTPRQKTRSTATLLAVSTLAPLLLASPLPLSPFTLGFLIFLYGLAFPVLFYVPPTIYILPTPRNRRHRLRLRRLRFVGSVQLSGKHC